MRKTILILMTSMLIVLVSPATYSFAPEPVNENTRTLCESTLGAFHYEIKTPDCGTNCRAAPATIHYCVCSTGEIRSQAEGIVNWSGCGTAITEENKLFLVSSETYQNILENLPEEELTGLIDPILQIEILLGFIVVLFLLVWIKRSRKKK